MSQRDRIFDRFYRVQEGRLAGEGAGLGLSIVDDIARAHQGTVSVSNGRERGSVFTVRLPLHERIERKL